jgi:hypothetical protein
VRFRAPLHSLVDGSRRNHPNGGSIAIVIHQVLKTVCFSAFSLRDYLFVSIRVFCATKLLCLNFYFDACVFAGGGCRLANGLRQWQVLRVFNRKDRLSLHEVHQNNGEVF